MVAGRSSGKGSQAGKAGGTGAGRDLLLSQIPGLVLFAILNAVLFVCYPYPYITVDSIKYVESASTLVNNLYRPLGYPVFLSFFHLLSSSATMVPFFQAAFYLLALAYFMISVNGVMSISATANRILGVVLALNPLPLFYSRHLLSDSVFISLVLFFIGSALRYSRKRDSASLLQMITWSGLALFVRHTGLLCLIFAALVIAVSLKGRCLKHLLIFVLMSTVTVCAICYKMKKDLGVFRLNTFDGWSLWSIAVPYVNLSPEYIESRTSEELKTLYAYLSSYPHDIYREKTGDWHRWNPDSPAKRLVYYYLQKYGLPYREGWIIVNDELKLVSKDILLHHIPDYLLQFYLPSLSKGFLPDMVMDDTNWYGQYPHYPRTPQSLRVISDYYGRETTAWYARFDIFPRVKPLIDAWVRCLMPIFCGLLIIQLVSGGRMNLFVQPDVHLVIGGFILFYVLAASSMSILWTRFFTPVTTLLVFADCMGIVKLYGRLFGIQVR